MEEALVEITAWATLLKAEWESTEVTNGEDGALIVLNYLGGSTVIPDYKTYNDMWLGGVYRNPVDAEWMKYKATPEDNDYIESVLNAMVEQVNMWSTDQETRTSLVYIYFTRLTESIDKLLNIAVEEAVEKYNIGSALERTLSDGSWNDELNEI